MRSFYVLALGFLGATSLTASTMYSIGPDPLGVPRTFTSITESGVTSTLFSLGDGSLGFNGGLAFRDASGLFYAIAHDGSGNSSLVSFSVWGGGVFTTIGSLGQGFVSGLAYSSTEDRLYAISTDSQAQSSLNWIDFTGAVNPIGALGTGFYGGLTFRPSDGLLYAFSGDELGVQRRFQSINPATAIATSLFQLGDGSASFNGGVAYNPANDLFYVISNDLLGFSLLQSFTLAGASTLTPISVIGGGFWNVGLAEATVVVPEPSSWGLLAAGMAGMLLRLRSRRR